MIFKKEPSFWVGLTRAVLAALIALHVLGLNDAQLAGILATETALLGFILALMVRPIAWPLLSGLLQSALALALTFGASLSQEQVGTIMGVVAFVVIFLDRSQVTPETKLPALPAKP